MSMNVEIQIERPWKMPPVLEASEIDLREIISRPRTERNLGFDALLPSYLLVAMVVQVCQGV